MANYLPVLLVSVAAGVPDDAALQPLPRGQVDYLSHEWEEDDVARSWRSMTKQKNEIANGLRLENASWRTWWKQRNNLKTVSPETLNWLKDSDVTWLYGPLHTAHDWTPPKPSTPSPVSASPPKSDSPRGKSSMKKSSTTTSLSSPSSSIALDRYASTNSATNARSCRNPPNAHNDRERGTAMKPILKHRSISEMLTSALPPSPFFSHYQSRESDAAHEDGDAFAEEGEPEEDVEGDGRDSPRNRRATFGGAAGRPPMFHTKSDTNMLPRFGAGKRELRVSSSSPPRVAPSAVALDLVHEHPLEGLDTLPPVSPTTPHGGSSMFTASQRSGAVGNLANLPYVGGVFAASTSDPSSGSLGAISAPPMGTRSGSGSGSASNTYPTVDGPSIAIPSEVFQDGRSESVNSNTNSSGFSDEISPTYSSSHSHSYHLSNGQQSSQQPVPPQKKHISFNAIVEQCIAIEGGTPDALDVDAGLALAHSTHDDPEEDVDLEEGSLGVKLMKRGWTGKDSDNGRTHRSYQPYMPNQYNNYLALDRYHPYIPDADLDSYDEDEEDGMYEDVGPSHVEPDSDSPTHVHSSRGYEWDAQDEMRRSHHPDISASRIYGRPRLQDDDDDDDDEEEEEVLEIRTPSRRNSSSSLNAGASQKVVEFSGSLSTYGLETSVFDPSANNANTRPSRADQPKRPRFRRTSTNKSNKSSHTVRSTFSGSGSGSGSNSNSRSRSGGGHGGAGYGGSVEREHVTIAPIAPTMLKAEAGSSGDSEDAFAFAPPGIGGASIGHSGYGGYDAYGEEGVLYAGGVPVTSAYNSNNHRPGGDAYAYNNSPYSGYTNLPGSGYVSGYGYGGYGFGEQVSAGRDVVWEGFEHGPVAGVPSTSTTRGEPGELVYQAPDGSVHPWSDQEAIRFRTQLEFGASTPGGVSPVSGSPPVRGGQIVFPPSMGRSQVNAVLGVPLAASPAPMGDEREYFGSRTMGKDGQNVRIVLPRLQEGDDSAERQSNSPPMSQLQVYTADSIRRERDRTPSPDFLNVPPTNPRVATLRSESFRGTPPVPVPPSDTPLAVSSSPSPAIPVPIQSTDFLQNNTSVHGTQRSPSESPTAKQGSSCLLSPPDVSPGRGRSTCASPIADSVSGSTTSAPSSASSSSFDARSVSDSRSDSRGRSRTRNSSISASSDVEPERGRSRSRSTNCSGAASPLSDSSSPHARRLPTSASAVALGGGVGHSGREIRDGRGTRLYRKTSEDCIGRGEERGRSSESRRVRMSESLSPPTMGGNNANGGSNLEAKVFGGYYRPPSSSGLQNSKVEASHTASESSKPAASEQGVPMRNGTVVKPAYSHSDNAISGKVKSNITVGASSTDDSRSAYSSRSAPISYRHRSNAQDSKHLESLETSSLGSGSTSSSYTGSSTMSDGRTLPPSIPEEDEQSLRSRSQTPVSTPVTALAPVLPEPQSSRTISPILSVPVPTPSQEAEAPLPAATINLDASSKAKPSRTASIGSTSPPPKPRSPEVPLPNITRVVRASSSGASSPTVTTVDAQGTGTFANRAADIMSSARSLLGTIWSGTTA